MASHTPGPWKVVREEDPRGSDDLVIFGADGSRITTMEFSLAEPEADRAQLDAALIAAAPDLLEALIDLYSCTEKMEGVADDHWYTTLEKAKAALAKAGGC